MVWSQFSIMILGVYFDNSVLYNSNWDKISNSNRKKNQYFEESTTLFGMKKKIVIQTLVYKSNILDCKIYQRGNWKSNSSTLHLEV